MSLATIFLIAIDKINFVNTKLICIIIRKVKNSRVCWLDHLLIEHKFLLNEICLIIQM